jgi:hypothetical protein
LLSGSLHLVSVIAVSEIDRSVLSVPVRKTPFTFVRAHSTVGPFSTVRTATFPLCSSPAKGCSELAVASTFSTQSDHSSVPFVQGSADAEADATALTANTARRLNRLNLIRDISH